GDRAGAADAVIPLPSAVKAQLDKYLGPGVVGEPVAAPPLLAAGDYLPRNASTLTYRVLEKDEDPRTEIHKVEDTTDPRFAPGWRYVADPLGPLYLRKATQGGPPTRVEYARHNAVV